MAAGCINGARLSGSSTQPGAVKPSRALCPVRQVKHSSGPGVSASQPASQTQLLHAHCLWCVGYRPPVPLPQLWLLQQDLATGVSAQCLLVVFVLLSMCARCARRTKISSWHLAYTRVTPQVVGLLSSVDNIVLLDLRGSGVRAGQLAPLRARHALSASFQGAVLSRTAAMVLASVTLEQFVCADAAQHGAAVAAVRAGPAAVGQGGASQQWVNQGVNALLQAAAASAAQQA